MTILSVTTGAKLGPTAANAARWLTWHGVAAQVVEVPPAQNGIGKLLMAEVDELQADSARSILAESILRKDGAGRFRSFSAGSDPKGEVNPLALKTLAIAGYPTDGLRSKSWEEFATPEAPAMDFVFTVCDSAAGEARIGSPAIICCVGSSASLLTPVASDHPPGAPSRSRARCASEVV